MKHQTLVAMMLILAGILGLTYGGFTYTKARHQVSLGAVQLSIDEKKHVDAPLWAGLGLLAAGGILLIGTKKVG